MRLVNGKFIRNSPNFSATQIKKLGSEYEELTFIKGQGYIAPCTYRNFIRANRSDYYKPVTSETESLTERMVSRFTKLKHKFMDHQVEIQNAILTRRQCIIASEQRTGKTLPTLDSIYVFMKDLKDRGITNPSIKEFVYWIAPVSGVRSVTDEITKWWGSVSRFEADCGINLRLLTYEMWRGNWLNGKHKLNSLENINAFLSVVEKSRPLIPRICIFDEVHKLKTSKGIQGSMSRLMHPAQSTLYEDDFLLIGLSGTPAPKEPSDWWNILEMTNPAFLRENSQESLKDRLAEIYMKQDEASGMAFPAVKQWLPLELEKFSKEIEPIVTTIWKNEVLDIPAKDHEFIILPINKDVKQAVRFLEAMDLQGAQLRQKLRQISDGFMYSNEYNSEENLMERSIDPIETSKQDQLKKDLLTLTNKGFPWQQGEYAQSLTYNRVMITGGYRGTIDIIRRICIKGGWDVLELTGQGWRTFSSEGGTIVSTGSKAKALEWLPYFDRSKGTNSPRKIAIIGHPKSMATGLELSMCPLMIAYSHTDDGESEMQVLDRPHSMNMDKELGFHIRHYCHLKYDLLISKSLRDKKKFQAITMSDIKQSISQDLWEGEHL